MGPSHRPAFVSIARCAPEGIRGSVDLGRTVVLAQKRHRSPFVFRLEAPMEQRIMAVSSLPLVDGFGITALLDDQGRWHVGALYRGLVSIAMPIREEDRERGFDSAE